MCMAHAKNLVYVGDEPGRYQVHVAYSHRRMWQPFVIIILLLFLVPLLLLLVKKSAAKSDETRIPCPPKLPFLGHVHLLSASFSHRSLHALSDVYGPLMLLQLGHIPTLIVSSPEMAREVLKTQDLTFASRPVSKLLRVLLYGCTFSNLAPYGDGWRQAKKLCTIYLLGSKMIRSFQRTREEEVEWMMTKIRRMSSLNRSGVVEMSEIIKTFTGYIITRAISVHFFKEESRIHELVALIEEFNSFADVEFHLGDFFPMLVPLDIFGVDARVKRCSKRLDAVLEEVLTNHANKLMEGDEAADEPTDFMGALLSLEKERRGLGVPISREDMKQVLLDAFAGGTGTSSLALTWSLAELARNAEAMKKLQDEVRNVAGRRGMVREEDLGGMTYLKAVVKEVLRLHSAGEILLPRETMADCYLGGYKIAKKTRVLVNAWAINRDPRYWEEPDRFKPERFVNSPIDFTGDNFHYIPFGGGRRSCPGMNFALRTVEVALANLVCRFDWELPRDMKTDLDTDDFLDGGLELVAKIVA